VDSKNSKKIVIVVVLVGLVVVFRIFGLRGYLSLSHPKDSREKFTRLYAAHKFSKITAYMVRYILATSLSVPKAVVMTIAGSIFW